MSAPQPERTRATREKSAARPPPSVRKALRREAERTSDRREQDERARKLLDLVLAGPWHVEDLAIGHSYRAIFPPPHVRKLLALCETHRVPPTALAVAAMRAHLAERPGDPFRALDFAFALEANGEIDAAIRVLKGLERRETVLWENDTLECPPALAGLFLADAGRHEEALASYRRALRRLKDKRASVLLHIATVHLERERWEEASRALATARRVEALERRRRRPPNPRTLRRHRDRDATLDALEAAAIARRPIAFERTRFDVHLVIQPGPDVG